MDFGIAVIWFFDIDLVASMRQVFSYIQNGSVTYHAVFHILHASASYPFYRLCY